MTYKGPLNGGPLVVWDHTQQELHAI